MISDPIIIRVAQHSEGGLGYDIFAVDPDELYDEDPEDGGICTSGMHNEDCKNDACEGCREAMDKPYTREDYKNALEMAVEQTLDLLFPKKG